MPGNFAQTSTLSPRCRVVFFRPYTPPIVHLFNIESWSWSRVTDIGTPSAVAAVPRALTCPSSTGRLCPTLLLRGSHADERSLRLRQLQLDDAPSSTEFTGRTGGSGSQTGRPRAADWGGFWALGQVLEIWMRRGYVEGDVRSGWTDGHVSVVRC